MALPLALHNKTTKAKCRKFSFSVGLIILCDFRGSVAPAGLSPPLVILKDNGSLRRESLSHSQNKVSMLFIEPLTDFSIM